MYPALLNIFMYFYVIKVAHTFFFFSVQRIHKYMQMKGKIPSFPNTALPRCRHWLLPCAFLSMCQAYVYTCSMPDPALGFGIKDV